ncbi:putative vacuolar protein sorting protein 16 [Leptomonas seymouri]|uniref:Putative vacuolar protein sorting protein 16 n=1 Tax=Leptomonas seymouri TaxID=5684 RepID=A0A0N1PBQ5_LEPSE|nr:putative vacuolar protein sorting protein 16 [Leptomonas seymouri]|eukprot:KPI86308.1 putative vacuolar protein sorting protein 16 [Leptomonas seymouri]
MVDRVGDWYAFSRTAFCRRLTLYEDLQWRSPTHALAPKAVVESENAEQTPLFSLATAELVALAPFGGPIAVLSHAADFTTSPTPSSSPPEGSMRACFNLSAHSATGAASRAIHVFTNAGELLTSFPLSLQDVGQDVVKTLGWTPEGELFFLLEPSLAVVFIDMRDIAVAASETPAASRASTTSTSVVSRRVFLKPPREGTAEWNPTSASPTTPIEAFCVATEGLLCVAGDGSGQLYGILHEEKFRSLLVPSVRLPLHPSSSWTPRDAEGLGQAASAAASRPRVTAVDMVPPAWNDSGDFIVLWAQHDEGLPGKSLPKRSEAVVGAGEREAASMLCAMALPDGDMLDCCCSDASGRLAAAVTPTLTSTWSAARIACAGRVLNLSVCVSDPTRVGVFTSLGVLHIFRSNLSCVLHSLDLGLNRVLRDVAMKTTHTHNDDDASHGGGFGSGALSSHSFVFGDVPWHQSDIDLSSNTSFAGGGAAASGGRGGSAGSSFRGFPPTASARGENVESEIRLGEFAVSCPSPFKLEWCGAGFVLLHFYLSDFQQPYNSCTACGPSVARPGTPVFSLLVCTQKGCSVHCERLDWSQDGSGSVFTVAEVDGVRVVSDTTCYFLQEIPPSLAKLCRVQQPFSAAAQVVLAYQAYVNGDRHGIAQVRAALSFSSPSNGSAADSATSVPHDGEVNNDDDDFAVHGGDEGVISYAEGIVYELLDAASYELDVEQQYLLVAAASFAGETICLRSGVPDMIVDVVRRLRVLRAVREEACCHIPLTMGQYQVLSGEEERPARLLSSSEGSVLVDRLAYLGFYQLALDVVRALHMKSNRVLSRWSSSFVRRHAAVLSDAVLHRELTQVLKQYPGASYVEPAATAFRLGRRELALRLLRDEPQQQRQRVMLCVKMGELAMAGRAAAVSGSAELIHLVVCTLVTKEAQVRRGHALSSCGSGAGEEADGEASPAAAGTTVEDIYHCFMASPELLCWLLVGAQCLVSWQSMAQRFLLTRHWSLASLECQHMLVQCLGLGSVMHRTQLQRFIAEAAAAGGPWGPPSATALTERKDRDGVGDAGGDEDEQRKSRKEGRKQKKRKHRHHSREGGGDGSGDSDGEETSDGGGADQGTAAESAASCPLPPLLGIHAPTSFAASEALAEWTRRTNGALLTALQHTQSLRRENSAARHPFSVILESAEQLRADMHKAATQGSDDGAQISRGGKRVFTNDGVISDGGSGRRSGFFSPSVLSREETVRTTLSTPYTTPEEGIAALKKEQALCQLKVNLAAKHNAPQLASVVSVVDLIHELCGIEDGEVDAANVQRTFKVREKMFFYAKLRGLCAARRWDAVDRFLGPAPPLRKRSFLSLSEGDTAKTPCIGYLPVVQLLTECKQEERAARYVAGACSEVVDRVVLYMSLNAPLMALEAAMVAKDTDLLQQIMQRAPRNATVQSVGAQMLNELRKD